MITSDALKSNSVKKLVQWVSGEIGET